MSNEVKDFARKVHEYFDGIASEHAMLCLAQPHEHAVKYESPSASLLVYYDNIQDHEAGVTIGKIPNPSGIDQRPFELWEVLRSQNSPESGTSGYLDLEDQSSLSLALERLAKLTKDSAEKLLDGDAKEFARLAEFRRCENLNITRDGQSREPRRDRSHSIERFEIALAVTKSLNLGVAGRITANPAITT